MNQLNVFSDDAAYTLIVLILGCINFSDWKKLYLSLYNTNCLLFCTEKYKPEVDNADRACEVCILTEGLYFEVRITNS